MPLTIIPRMHCGTPVKISSPAFETKTFLTYHSLRNFEIRLGSH